MTLIPCHGMYLPDEKTDIGDIFDKISMGKGRTFWYLITLSDRTDRLFEIYTAKELSQPTYRNKTLYVAGFARGRRGMLNMLEEILLEIYNKTKGFNVHSFFNP